MTQQTTEPTTAELELLKQFWRHGDLSAREVHDRAGAALGWTLSTTRTLLDRMQSKGLIVRLSVHGIAVYRQAEPKVKILDRIMRRFSAALEIDGSLPVAAFSGSRILDADELAELEALLNPPADAEGDQ